MTLTTRNNDTSEGICVILNCFVDVDYTILDADLDSLDVYYWICTSFVLLYGIPITVGIVHYELNAGDPQKRSLGNRFVSKGSVSCLVSALSIECFVGALRYNVSPEQVTTFFFKQFVAFLFAAFWFGNLITLMRYLQVVVWKRVKEINENLIDRATCVSVILITQALGLLCNPEYKLLVAVSTFSKQPAHAPFSACKNDIDPFHQKISIRAHVVAGMLMHTFAIVSIKICEKLTVPSTLNHDEDSINLRNARYNKALTTLKSLPVFLVFYAVCLAHIVVASKAQADQTVKQLFVWSTLGPSMLLAPTVFVMHNQHARKHMWRMIFLKRDNTINP